MKKYFFIIIILFSIIVFPVYAEVSTSTGFIPGQIWYGQDDLIEGKIVDIYTAVWNGEANTISVKVEFYDKSVILGTRDVTLASLELKDVFIPWKITSGDHVISAKITSSTATISGKKEKVVLDNVVTSNDKQSISVLVKDEQGNPVLGTDAIKTKLENTGSKINDMLPEKVSDSISDGFVVLENFRQETSIKVNESKNDAKKELDLIKDNEDQKNKIPTEKSDIQDATKKPITYIKLFLFSALSFIFMNKIIFYALLILIIFLVLRKIYRTIRNK